MIKSYEEMRRIDVSKYVKDRDGFSYLNWAKCIELLHDNGAEVVYFEPIPDERTGSSLRMTDVEFKDKNGVANRCYETKIKVVIDDKTYYMQTPIMNGSNPVKDNSMNQSRVWAAMCRAFVKCVAINTGLGFSLWVKEETEDKPFESEIPVEDRPATEPQIICIKHYADAFHLNIEKWLNDNGVTWETLTDINAAKMLRTLSERYGELEYGEDNRTSE